MKKLLSLITATPLVVGLASCGNSAAAADPVIRIAIDSDGAGNALVAAWNANTNKGNIKVEFVNTPSNGLPELVATQQSSQADIILAPADQMITRQHHFKAVALPATVTDKLDDTYTATASDNMNVFYPAFANTTTFAYNAKLLGDVYGVDVTTDTNSDGLPDAIDSWAKIQALTTTLTTAANHTANGKFMTQANGTVVAPANAAAAEKVGASFAIDPGNSWTSYPLVSHAGFDFKPVTSTTTPSANDIITAAGGRPKFEQGFDLIKDFAASNVYGEKVDLASTETLRKWEESLPGGKILFGQVGTWIDFTGDAWADIKFAPFPDAGNSKMFNGPKGYAVNKYSPNQTAAAKVLEWLFTTEALEAVSNNSAYIPSFKSGATFVPAVTGKKKQYLDAISHTAKSEVLSYIPGMEQSYMNLWHGATFGDLGGSLWAAGSGQGTPAHADVTDGATAVDKWITIVDAWIAANK